jgi:arylsulfatase A-like enzyme
MPDRPNVLLVMTDQHRGDALGADPRCPTDADGSPLVHTPNLDHLVADGALFSSAYSPAPTCIPARRCLWTGRRPANCDATHYHGREWDFEAGLPRTLRDAGYQTMLAGKTHSLPYRNRIGFEETAIHAALGSPRPRGGGFTDDYIEWLDRRSGGDYDENSHGLDRNSWDPRPWHRPEHEHPTNWTTARALEHLERRDPTRPFFMTVSYVRPHQPFDPPAQYLEYYLDAELPEPAMGDWADDAVGDLLPEHPSPDAWVADLPPRVIRRARAAYYGSITHVDHQFNRLVTELGQRGELEDTLIVFTADHGEMLGDHYHWRKGYAYEGSARVPLLVRPPAGQRADGGDRIVDRPVGLEDVAPTVLDATGVDPGASIDGGSLFDLLAGGEWRERYHGEHGPTYHEADACQFLVDDLKYVWNPVTGEERLFDLDRDPDEETDRTGDPTYADALDERRADLAARLADRPEGFSDGERLATVSEEMWS